MSRDIARMMVALIVTVVIVSATIGGTIALTGVLSPAPADLHTVPVASSPTLGQVAVVPTYTPTATETQMLPPTFTATATPTPTNTSTPTVTPTFTPAPADPCADPAAYRAVVVTEQPRLSPLLGTVVADGEQMLVATWTVENGGTCPWRAVRFIFDRVSQTPAPSAPPQLRQPTDTTEWRSVRASEHRWCFWWLRARWPAGHWTGVGRCR